ncbi:efflux RND transporter periplasmic adaptor subunit [Flavobacterium sp. Sd200]|uniref:efflux RND transporter periplasmic adaptor subunit n=1 Tax=Flavobacterium sp. Sd200 TaxID=2692211 RepID=UPI001368BE3C|nr:efflux RND transporter periplasmic adaptor subunit [Flavobacterium sp. Sd200]MXN91382.1 efflux RND transporter periplasmic adaptor subunit [Flavobacterium sp. Sd200]
MRNKSFLGAMAAIIMLSACGKKEEAPQQAAAAPVPFPVQTVTKQDATVFEEYTANLEGRQNVEIRPKVTGFITKIFVDEGQTVRKGQILFKLETQTQNQDAAAAKAAVNAAQVEVNRLAPLVERKIISNVQLETAKANLAQVQANYQAIATNIGFGTITSPVDGVIGSLPLKEGALVSPTSEVALTTVSDTRVMRAYFALNEKQMLNFSKTFKGATLEQKLKNTPAVTLLLVDGSEYDQKGRIEAVTGLVNATTGTSQFRAEFKNPQAILRSGSNGIIRLPINYNNAIVVPQNAVFELQGKQMLYVVDKDGTVKSKVITTRTTSGTDFIVEEGLEEGEVIVVEGASKLKDGMKIIPQEAKKEQPADAPIQDTVASSVSKTKTVTTKK